MHLNLKGRPTLQKTLAGIVALVIAAVGMIMFGGDEEKDRQVVEELCARGLEDLALRGGLDLCTHGPDPIAAFPRAMAKLPATSVNLFYRQSSMCPGDGVSGERVHLYVGAPSDKPPVTSAFVSKVKQTLGLAERQMRLSHPTHAQKINYYCATDRTPTINRVTFPPVGADGSFDFEDAFHQIARTATSGTHVAFPANVSSDEYSYCGEGTVRVPGDSGAHFSLIAPFCLSPSDTLLHELGHNMGAVAPSAPNDSGAYHCHDLNDILCYNDGGSFFANGGQMVQRCDKLTYNAPDGNSYRLDRMDCGHNDYWNPASPLPWISAETSPLLTAPRRK